MYKGELKGFPKEVVDKMLERQVEQGNKKDISVFEIGAIFGVEEKGFTWEDSPEGHCFWSEVILDGNFGLFFDRYPKFQGDIDKLNVFQKPTTEEERDKLIQELQAMEFKKELPSDLPCTVSDENSPHALEYQLIELLRMRDTYRDGWVVSEYDTGWFIDIDMRDSFVVVLNGMDYLAQFSFQNKETAELFLNNFKKDLEEVKHLIS